MRTSIIRQSQSVARGCEAVPRRYLSTQSATRTMTRTRSIVSCQACNSAKYSHKPTRNISIEQKRMRSTAPSTSTSTSDSSPNASNASTTTPQIPTNPKTHYDFFPLALPLGPPPSGPFAIDVRALRREFLQLQAVAHPDLHPPHLKSRAEATSARINEAYKTLQNPLLRAQYLLGLRGLDVSGDETAKLGGEEGEIDEKELLMEVLEAREEIEACVEEEELVGLRAVNEERMRESEKVIGEALKGGQWDLVGREAVRLRYWVNIKESLDGWEKGKGAGEVHH